MAMAPDSYDVFLSSGWERDAGRLISTAIEQRGLRVFEDTSRPDEPPDEVLLAHIASALIFVVILSPRSLDRVGDPGNPSELLRRKIAHALKTGRTIIPVIMEGFSYPRELPADIEPLPRIERIGFSELHSAEAISEIILRAAGSLPGGSSLREIAEALEKSKFDAALEKAAALESQIKRYFPKDEELEVLLKAAREREQQLRLDASNESAKKKRESMQKKLERVRPPRVDNDYEPAEGPESGATCADRKPPPAPAPAPSPHAPSQAPALRAEVDFPAPKKSEPLEPPSKAAPEPPAQSSPDWDAATRLGPPSGARLPQAEPSSPPAGPSSRIPPAPPAPTPSAARLPWVRGARGEAGAVTLPLQPVGARLGRVLHTAGRRMATYLRHRTRGHEGTMDPVDCTVFSPSTVAQGDSFLVQVFSHRPEQSETAKKLATEYDQSAERRGFKSLETEIRRGTWLRFHLAIPGLRVNDDLQQITWRGTPQPVQFGVTVPLSAAPGNVIGTVTVDQESIPLGYIKFKLTVRSASEERVPWGFAAVGEAAHRYHKAFISYASEDRLEVLKRVQMLSQLRIGFFQDILSLEPGERWERALYRHIDDSDLFLLFWSTAAKQSKWVLEEVRYAIKRKGNEELAPPEILPVLIEGPPPVEPPQELAHLHFNDRLLYFMAQPPKPS
jgi:hypothetical protein